MWSFAHLALATALAAAPAAYAAVPPGGAWGGADDALGSALAAGEELLPVRRTAYGHGLEVEALLGDDECAADDGEACAVSALQMRGYKVRSASEGEPQDDQKGVEAANKEINAGIFNDVIGKVKRWLFGKSEAQSENHGQTQAQAPYRPPESQLSGMKGMKRGNWDPPSYATQYNGIAWNEMVFNGTDPMHVFTIADWGNLLGEWYGTSKGGHTFAISRPGCGVGDMNQCFSWNGNKSHCKAACGYVVGVDDRAQTLVADAMRQRAKSTGVQYLLNAGDNFYPLGIETNCGHPMDRIAENTKRQFEEVFQWVYWGAELAGDPSNGKPWLSVLGNHDYGARQFNYAWDQQIAFTWTSNRWTMPAQYFSQHVSYPDQGFSADIFMIDSNVEDVGPICSSKYNAEANCGKAHGPTSADQCGRWFQELWDKQAHWLESKLAESTADWQIVVTHFPCGHKPDFYKRLHETFGLDLMVTGHVHEQTIHTLPGGMTCLVSGGGGGVTSERSPDHDMSNQYGFFDLTLTKDQIKVELVNFRGKTVTEHSVHPRKKAANAQSSVRPAPAAAPMAAPAAASCAAYGCGGYRPGNACQCNAGCQSHGNCCSDYANRCAR